MINEWDSENNLTPVFLPDGRVTNKDQLRRDGVYSWDSTDVLNQKQGGGAYSPSTSSSTAPLFGSRTPVRILAALAIAAGIAYVSLCSVVLFPIELTGSYVKISYPGQFTAKQRAMRRPESVKDLKTEYGRLYTADAPLEKFAESCMFKSCLSPDIGSFQKLEAYAKSPDTYWNDFCEIGYNWKFHEKLEFGKGAGKPKFDISTVSSGTAVVTTCTLNNPAELKSAYLLRAALHILAIVSALLVGGFLLKKVWKATENFGH